MSLKYNNNEDINYMKNHLRSLIPTTEYYEVENKLNVFI